MPTGKKSAARWTTWQDGTVTWGISFLWACTLFKGVKVGLDCANGSSWNIAKAVFDALGAKTYVINAQPDGTNINDNAGSTHIEGLQQLVVEKGLDVGFAYDGDADRCLCVDEQGRVVDGDAILYLQQIHAGTGQADPQHGGDYGDVQFWPVQSL